LGKLLHILGEGDALVVTRLDCLGRSMRDLANIAHEIDAAGANLKVLEQHVDTSTSAGRAFFDMLAVFAAKNEWLAAEFKAHHVPTTCQPSNKCALLHRLRRIENRIDAAGESSTHKFGIVRSGWWPRWRWWRLLRLGQLLF
jgi:hypothetical protein